MTPADGPGRLSARVLGRLRRHVPEGSALCVAFSGGLDSSVLLDLVASRAATERWTVRAVHVHHGLSPNAEAWSQACATFCAARDVPLAIARVHIDPASRLGIEGAAREARHAVFADRDEPFILLAHHLADQAETVLLQLLRGTGIKGAAAMPEKRVLGKVTLLRPLLAEARKELEAYAEERGLRWVEDESNATSRFDRNYLRREIAPLLEARFPQWRLALARFAGHAAEANSLLEDIAEDDGPVDASLPRMTILPRSNPARRANALRAFLARQALPMPSEAQLAEIVRQVYDAADDRAVCIAHGGAWLRRHRRHLYVERSLPAEGRWQAAWHGEREVELGERRGRVIFGACTGEGVALSSTRAGEWHFAPRRGGERIRLAEGRPTRTLKNLLQESSLTPWQRQNIPLLFRDGRLAWAWGIGTAAEVACKPGEPGLSPTWDMPRERPL